jgi:hypothetical protein
MNHGQLQPLLSSSHYIQQSSMVLGNLRSRRRWQTVLKYWVFLRGLGKVRAAQSGLIAWSLFPRLSGY